MKKSFTIIILLALSATVFSQKVNFYSGEFAAGVKIHLDLTEDEDVLQSQMDTITDINLSAMMIADVRDAVYMPNVKKLNLSGNRIKDISPLIVLDSLQELNLKGNELDDINMLAFSSSKQMTVDVTQNYITDFSYIMAPTPCQFTIVGAEWQSIKNPPYFKVNNFYVMINDKGYPEVYYQGQTNIDKPVRLEGLTFTDDAVMDNRMHTQVAMNHPIVTTKLFLTNGEQKDSTYVLPPTFYPAKKDSPILIETGLPEDYRIISIAAHGSVEMEGTIVKYTASEDLMPDTIRVCYYQGSDLKGYGLIPVGLRIGDANADGKVTITDAVGIVNKILGNPSTGFVDRAADVNRDTHITITDAVGVVNIILNSGSSAPKMDVVGPEDTAETVETTEPE